MHLHRHPCRSEDGRRASHWLMGLYPRPMHNNHWILLPYKRFRFRVPMLSVFRHFTLPHLLYSPKQTCLSTAAVMATQTCVTTASISKEETLSLAGHRHACHVMLYANTKAKLFGRTPIKHIVLMQMRFDGLLGFPGGLVDPSAESLEAGLSRELKEELGVAVPVSPEDHVVSCHAPSCPTLITHFYVKKMEESEIKEVERAAVTMATDHGLEVMGMVRVPLYFLKKGGGLPSFLSHSFIGNSRSQLLSALQQFSLLSQGELDEAVRQADQLRQRPNLP
ncbi:hypothetical protein ACEWY4_000814 [Coilia grayii]|uniref:U8 snoRNA-decapping enzyme n=1 Tax=Coilia grayii TaxID=363190 RepID=A0ABD1KXQ4_9TELE